MILKNIHEESFPNKDISCGGNVETGDGDYPEKQGI